MLSAVRQLRELRELRKNRGESDLKIRNLLAGFWVLPVYNDFSYFNNVIAKIWILKVICYAKFTF